MGPVVQGSGRAMIFTGSDEDQSFSSQAREDCSEPSGLQMGVHGHGPYSGQRTGLSTVPSDTVWADPCNILPVLPLGTTVTLRTTIALV